MTNLPFRVRCAHDSRWLRSFQTHEDAKSFAREHAIEHNCDMEVQRLMNPFTDHEAYPASEWEF